MKEIVITPQKEKLFIFAVLLASITATYNGVNIYIALPSLIEEFQTTMKDLQWAMIATGLASSITLPICGYFMDRFSGRRTFLMGLALLGVASVFGAVAPNVAILTIARFMQGMSGGVISAVSLAVVYQFLPKKSQLMAVALVSSATGFGVALAPTVSGALAHFFGWQSIFLVNLPVVLIAGVLTYYLVPYKVFDVHEHLDKVGLITSCIGTFGLMIAFNQGSTLGWTSPITLGMIGGSILILAFFVWYELQIDTPMLNFKVFYFPAFFLSFLFIALIAFATSSASTFMPLFLQNIIGLNELEAGLWLIIPASMMAIMTPISAKLGKRVNARVLILVGTLILLLGSWQMSRFTVATSAAVLIFWVAVRYSGMGIQNPIVNDFAMSVVPLYLVSHASALLNWSRQLFMAISLSLQTVLYSNHMDKRLAEGYQAELGLAEQMRWVECSAIDMISMMNTIIILGAIPVVFFFKDSFLRKRSSKEE